MPSRGLAVLEEYSIPVVCMYLLQEYQYGGVEYHAVKQQRTFI
jgi:hypothetical protein